MTQQTLALSTKERMNNLKKTQGVKNPDAAITEEAFLEAAAIMDEFFAEAEKKIVQLQ